MDEYKIIFTITRTYQNIDNVSVEELKIGAIDDFYYDARNDNLAPEIKIKKIKNKKNKKK